MAKPGGIRAGDAVEFTVQEGAITTHADESRYPTYTPTKAETAAMRRGREAYERGEFSTLADATDRWTLLVAERARKSLAKLPDGD